MRLFLFAILLVGIPQLAACQSKIPQRFDRPSFATTGKETMPMMLVDEAALAPERFEHHAYPFAQWIEEKGCLANLTGLSPAEMEKVGQPPELLVIPAVRTIRVHSLTVDSLLYADDSTHSGETWEPPTVAVALIHSNFIVITEEYRLNPYVLRHEALHFMLWRLGLAPLGHPREFFEPCDAHYDPALPGGRFKPNNDWR